MSGTAPRAVLDEARGYTAAMLASIERIRRSPYIPIDPTFKQWAFLLDDHRETLFGGSAGPGKSVGLLTSALEYAEFSGYHAILLRRTFPDLNQPGALMPMAAEWLRPTAARLAGGKTWMFPSGSTLSFGYLDSENAKYQYQGAEFQFVGFDELTQFTKTQYTYLFSRLRRSKRHDARVPLRMRATSNPGGTGHDWVKARFIRPQGKRNPSRMFLPARLEDNPYLDIAEYELSLAELDPVTRRQLRGGDWEVTAEGNFFTTSKIKSRPPFGLDAGRVVRCRGWDLAATKDGDWTAGVLVAYRPEDRSWLVEDVVRVRQEPGELERTILATAIRDGRNVVQVVEQEGGSSGKMAARDLRTRVLAGYPVHLASPTGSKEDRARLPAALTYNGDVGVVPAVWNVDFLDELTSFPGGSHDDQVDGLAYACHHLAGQLDSAAWVAYLRSRTGVRDEPAPASATAPAPVGARPSPVPEEVVAARARIRDAAFRSSPR